MDIVNMHTAQVLLQTNSKFLPTELTMVAGEQWEAELPDLGKVLVLIPFSMLTFFVLNYSKDNSLNRFALRV